MNTEKYVGLDVHKATTVAVVLNAKGELVVGVSVNATTIQLTWTDNSTDETGFEVSQSLLAQRGGPRAE